MSEPRMTNNQEAAEWSDLMRRNSTLEQALKDVVSDVLEYEKSNNLAPNPGRKYCWDSVERAVALLEKE